MKHKVKELFVGQQISRDDGKEMPFKENDATTPGECESSVGSDLQRPASPERLRANQKLQHTTEGITHLPPEH